MEQHTRDKGMIIFGAIAGLTRAYNDWAIEANRPPYESRQPLQVTKRLEEAIKNYEEKVPVDIKEIFRPTLDSIYTILKLKQYQ